MPQNAENVLSTHVVFTVDVVVPTNMTAADLLDNHGISNFCFHTREKLMDQLEEAVAMQCAEQHAEAYADSAIVWKGWSELGRMLKHESGRGYFRTPEFNLESARAIREAVGAVFAKYNKEIDGGFPYLFEAIEKTGK